MKKKKGISNPLSMSLKHKAFLTALSLITSESRKAKSFLTDKRMSQQEKMILSGFLALRDFENAEVISVLEKVISPDRFVESQRHFCLGAAHNNLTHFKEAEYHLLQSLELNNFADGLDRRMATCQTLFTVYANSHQLPGMENMIEYLKSITPQSKFLLEIRAYSEFCFLIQKKDFLEAKKMVPKMELIFPDLKEIQAICYLYDLFDLYLQEDDAAKMDEVLERIKRSKKYKNPAHIKFMQTLLKFIYAGTPIYLYEKDFQEYPYLSNQLLCLQALEKGDQKAALVAWNSLQAPYPDLYPEPFHYSGPFCLFEKCLNKIMAMQKATPEIPLDISGSREEKLIYLLKSSGLPLQKESLYEALWGKSMNSKDDLKKLVKVVQRAREKFAVEIKSVKGSYSLVVNKAS